MNNIIDISYIPKNPTVRLKNDLTGQEIITDNELLFNYIRAQISRWKYEGWYVIYEDVRYDIDNNGNIQNKPLGLFDQNDELNSYMYKYQKYPAVNDLRENLIDMEVEYEVVERPKKKK